MQERLLIVYYGVDRLPYKDENREVHYPIISSSTGGTLITGENNTSKLYFYVGKIGGSGRQWIANIKKPDGTLSYLLCTNGQSVTLDNGEQDYRVELDIASLFADQVGDVYIGVQGYSGDTVIVENDGTYEISGNPIVIATGTIKIKVNYAPSVLPKGETLSPTTEQLIMAALGGKMDTTSGIITVSTIEGLQIDSYEDGQVIFDETTKKVYKVSSNELVHIPYQLENSLVSENTIEEEFNTKVDKTSETWKIYGTNGSGEQIKYHASNTPAELNSVVLRIDSQGHILVPTPSTTYHTANKAYVDTGLDGKVTKVTSGNKIYATASGSQTTLTYSVLPTEQVPIREGGYIIFPTATPPTDDYGASWGTIKSYVATYVASQISSVYKYKGSVATYDDLPSTDLTIGDVYNVEDTGANYAWTGTTWDSLGGVGDMSNYYTKSETYSKSEVDTALGGKVDKTISARQVYGTNAFGQQITYTVDSTNSLNTIVRRDGNGQIQTSLSPNTIYSATSKQYVDNRINEVMDYANGKCKTYIVSYSLDSIAKIKSYGAQIVNFYVYNSTTKEFENKTTELANGDFDNYVLDNSKFNSQSDSISLDSDNYLVFGHYLGGGTELYMIDVSDFAYGSSHLANPGDVILVVETEVPDRWCGTSEYILFKLETTKVDLTNVAKTNQTNTFTQPQIFADAFIDKLNPNASSYGLTLPDTTSFTADKEIATTDGTFNVINATDIVSNTLTQAQYDLITNGKPTLIKGNYGNYYDLFLLPSHTSTSTYFDIAGICYFTSQNGRTATISTYTISATKVLTITNNDCSIVLDEHSSVLSLVSANSMVVRGKVVPNYPSNTGTFVLKCVDGTLTWVAE